MSYIMYYTTQVVSNPKITAIPKYVSCLMLGHINEVKLMQSSDIPESKESDLENLIDAFKEFGYKTVKSDVNETYMFLPSKSELVLKIINSCEKSNITIRKSTIPEAINSLSDKDIKINEESGDILKLSSYTSYKQRVSNLA